MATPDYGIPEPSELPAFRRIVQGCFMRTGEDERLDYWLGSMPREQRRVLRRRGEPVATLNFIPMGQFFGGRSVRTAGVSIVGVEPAVRGEGHGHVLMEHALRESREAGAALSTLYASTYAFYRRVGYERAGSRFLARVPAAALSLPPRAEGLRALREDDEKAVRAAWREWARRHSGQLDRGDYCHGRAARPLGQATHGVVVEGEGGIEGYVRWRQIESHTADDPYDVAVSDAAALTPRAVDGVLAVLARQRAMAGEIRWASSPTDPLLMRLDERRFRLELWGAWMVRVLDAPAALEARGWPRGLETELELDVTDELLRENAGRWRLAVADGAARVERVERGGSGRLRIGPRGLAALYTGHLSPEQLAALGWLEGEEDTLARAAVAFAGPAPWMTDMF